MNNLFSLIRKEYLIALIIILSISTAFAKTEIKQFKSIEFKDIYLLSKYEIIDLADISIKGKNLLVNMSLLERVLNDNPLVKAFKLIESEQKLIISIIENQPIFLISVNDGGRNTIVELDKESRIISVNRAHLLNSPLIFVSQEDINGSGISLRLKKFLDMINNLNRCNLPVMKEVVEIDYTDVHIVKILLKGRRTVFNLRPDRESFDKLNYAAGYFDRIKYYPLTFTMLNGQGVLGLTAD